MSTKRLSDKAILGMYYNTLEQGPIAWVGQLAMEVNSNQDTETHAWIGMPPSFREWIGSRQAKGFNDFEYSVSNKDYESTIEYHERDLAEDKTGQLQVRIDEHAARALSHPAALLTTLILNAESTLCYDGQYFFDTDHTEGDSGTQDNDLSVNIASATAPTAAEMEDAILGSIQKMLGYVDDRGEPLNETAKEFLVMVPVPFWKSARAAASAGVILDGGQGRNNLITTFDDLTVKVVANPRLTWTDRFATFRTDGRVKPFIDQVREKVTTDILGQNSEYFFDTRHIKVSMKKAGALGYGLWQGAVQTTFT